MTIRDINISFISCAPLHFSCTYSLLLRFLSFMDLFVCFKVTRLAKALAAP